MTKRVRYISISHETAGVAQRERFFIPDSDKRDLISNICRQFPDISGLLLLVTCNRTEIYIESETTLAGELRDFLILWNRSDHGLPQKKLFKLSEETLVSVKHLLRVSSGMSSKVLGDAEIIHQIKKAYQFSIKLKLQGSYLERAMQTVFKTHKRISNETEFRDGTTSAAYKSLKVISERFRGDHATSKKILFIGTGDIVRQLLKYNAKFNFDNIYLSNRTREKALILAKKYGCQIYEWKHVLDNTFGPFDVIISAAANCRHLIKKIAPDGKKRLLIDLALPVNIESSLARQENILFYDLDAISSELEDTKDKRNAAITKVDKLIATGLDEYRSWLRKAPFRTLLAGYKPLVNERIIHYYTSKTTGQDPQKIAAATDRIMRKLLNQPGICPPVEELDSIIEEHAPMTSRLVLSSKE